MSVTAEQVRELLNYDPETGVFTWRNQRGRCRAGDVAGSIDPVHGYRRIKIGPKLHLAHRLAWLVTHGEIADRFVDHINRVRHDNRLCNLRVVDRATNGRNRKGANKNSRFGLRGVSMDGNRFRATIKHNYRQTYLGAFDTPEEAHEAFLRAHDRVERGMTPVLEP